MRRLPSADNQWRRIVLAASLCLFAWPAVAAPPDDTGASLKPGASDLTGPVRGTHPVPGTTPAPAKVHRKKARHSAAPAAGTPK